MWKKMNNKSYKFKKEFNHVLLFLKTNFFIKKFSFFDQKSLFSSYFKTFFKIIIDVLFWGKVRVLYYTNNWIYTTNHKRIAVNYFWFVILSGIVGMVLATLIRLEFAYPGVGVFAGDSLQYLSMATAHGVIMVFFMIMPLLFGAFANFLIPTQLGVHDVAFPRLNSAAFWFLPGGLLMLCQLVCVDRRYQRMNCFNIREIQSILKKKFFTDLINSHDHKLLLDKTAMGLRFKTNNLNLSNSNIYLFYNYGIEISPKFRNSIFSTSLNGALDYSFLSKNSLFWNLILFFSQNSFILFFNNIFILIINPIFNLSSNLFVFSNAFKDFLYIFPIYFRMYIAQLWHSANNIFSSFLFIEPSEPLPNIDDPSAYVANLFSLSICFSIYRKLFFIFFQFIDTLFYCIQLGFFFTDYLQNKLQYLLDIRFYFTFQYLYFLIHDFLLIDKFFPISPLFNPKLNVKIIFNYFNISPSLSDFIDDLVLDLYFYETNMSSLPELSENRTPSDSDFKKIGSYFCDPFFSTLNYNSKWVYFHLTIYSIFNIPFEIFDILTDVFSIKNISDELSTLYEFLFDWFAPQFFADNILYSFYKNSNSYIFNPINISESKYYFFETIYNFLKISYLNFKINLINTVLLFSFIDYLTSFFIQFLFNFYSIFIYFIELSCGLLFSFSTSKPFLAIYNFSELNNIINNKLISNHSEIFYSSNYFSNLDLNVSNKYGNEESSQSQRYLRFYNPIFKYDYKSGDYFPNLYRIVYSSLFTSILDLTNSIRTSPWFLSDKVDEFFTPNFKNFSENISEFVKFENMKLHNWSGTRFNNTDSFYNLFYLLSEDFLYTNKKWIAINSLNQKFYKMFNTSSMQQRIYSNWRQLKFTREAWRCKLLAARHQKTLFRRYVHEDGVFWSIERNAKDLLPGWAMITPFSSRTRFTAVGKTDIGLMGVFLVLNSSIISGANFLVTYRYLSTLNNRKMRDARVFFTESIIVACWMMIFANPMLAIAIIMLLSDRHWQTSFFDYSGGGDTVLFQHMFWFFGHPEVYVIIIPTFGFANSMISYYLRKRVSARASLLYSMYTIAFLGFFVWGHHMYMVGLSHTTRMLFSTLTVMISVPAATKIMHWCVTTVNSSIAMELPLLFTFTFIFLFVSGGISGMCVAHTGMDILFHDTFYVIGHFHVMLAGGAMFSSFGAFYFYFPAIFGVKYSRIYAYLHYVYYLIGQLMTVIPMFWLGYAGMPRRVLDYPASMGGWHSVISAGHMLSVAGLMSFFIMIFDSLRQAKAVTRNTFGISRYNTRLNFYLYEISRLSFAQQKGYALFRFHKPSSIKLNELNYSNFEPYETTLISYSFLKR